MRIRLPGWRDRPAEVDEICRFGVGSNPMRTREPAALFLVLVLKKIWRWYCMNHEACGIWM